MCGLEKTAVEEEHFCVISDLHTGNPIFIQWDKLQKFIEYLSLKKISLCINGDGIDFLQTNTFRLKEALSFFHDVFGRLVDSGNGRVYYILGNHDFFMKNILEKLPFTCVTPRLEMVSGNKRIYVEHGHKYDFLFQHYQKIYLTVAKLFGKIINVYPNIFHGYSRIEWLLRWIASMLRNKKEYELCYKQKENPAYEVAAKKILQGDDFDTVILGHTHHHSISSFKDKKVYANAGTWTTNITPFLEICEGHINLRRWKG